ncbi:MAG TPA: SGNH/GDSL hydrolase family protein [Thermoanaerobaculia bacterium]
MRCLRRCSLIIALLVAMPAFSATRVLFIGNSLTYANDLPSMVVKLAKAEKRELVTKTLAFPDYSLEDHLNDRRTLAALRERWDFIVVQQGPSAMEESRTLLLRDIKRIAEKARDAKLVLFMVWPSRARIGDFARVDESYTLAAKSVGGILAPAGREWRASKELDALYGPDGFHPSERGSQVAAEVIYRSLMASVQ